MKPELDLLKRKLDGLNYAEPVDELSEPLVQRLVDDLVHTTESYRGLKHQTTALNQHLINLNDKAGFMSSHIFVVFNIFNFMLQIDFALSALFSSMKQ